MFGVRFAHLINTERFLSCGDPKVHCEHDRQTVAFKMRCVTTIDNNTNRTNQTIGRTHFTVLQRHIQSFTRSNRLFVAVFCVFSFLLQMRMNDFYFFFFVRLKMMYDTNKIVERSKERLLNGVVRSMKYGIWNIKPTTGIESQCITAIDKKKRKEFRKKRFYFLWALQ